MERSICVFSVSTLLRFPLVLAVFGILAAASELFADSLAPVVVGGVIDNSPQDGLGDVLDTGPFIANANGNQYRAIVEYDLSTVPAGTVLSASLTGIVVPNNAVDVGLREHLVEVYTGNGVVDLSDYSVPGIEVGQFSHNSGDSTNFDIDFTGVLHNLLAAGADYVGMRISPLSDPLPFDVLSTSEFVNPPRLNFEIFPEGGAIEQFLPLHDFRVEDDDGTLILTEDGNSIGVQQIDFAEIDRRGVLEFDLSTIPDGATITDAKIEFDIGSFSSSSGNYPEAPVYGYSADGLVSTADAFETATQIGTLGPVTSTGQITIDISPEFVDSLLASNDFLGITIVGDPDGQSLSFATNEFAAISTNANPAQLFLTYFIPPDPADFNDDGVVDHLDLQRWETYYNVDASADANGDGRSDGLDFFAWQTSAYGQASQLQAVQTIPEPTTATLCGLTLIIWTCRRRARVRMVTRSPAPADHNI